MQSLYVEIIFFCFYLPHLSPLVANYRAVNKLWLLQINDIYNICHTFATHLPHDENKGPKMSFTH